MRESDQILLQVEKTAVKWFLWIFYIVMTMSFVALEILKRAYTVDSGYSKYIFYIIMMFFLPISIKCFKTGNIYIIKYIYLFSYIIISMMIGLLNFLNDNPVDGSANTLELVFILFSLIFINKKYFWYTAFTILGKYVFLFSLGRDSNLLSKGVLIVICLCIAFVMLNRIQSYKDTLVASLIEKKKAERLAAVGKIATVMGEKIKIPIGLVKNLMELQNQKYPEDKKYYDIMTQEIDRINGITNKLFYMGIDAQVQYKQCDLQEILSYVIQLIKKQASERNIHITMNAPKAVFEIECDEVRLKQVFVNVLKNAIEATDHEGNIIVSLKKIENNKIKINIIDEGYGMDRETQARIWEDFYTTKEDGTGLGLIVTHKIIQEHHGQIQIRSDKGVGTDVEIILPVTQSE